jgi:xanthine dehydrogenase molybdenum-binding subunit
LTQVLETAEKARRIATHSRIDGTERVTGRARYAGDWRLEGMLHAAVVLSTIPHGTVKKFDSTAASSMEGVEAVVSCFEDKTRWHSGERTHERRVFTDRVRFVGDCVGAVAAMSRQLAREAAESVIVEYDELPAVVSIEAARAEKASRIWESGNVVGPTKYGFGDLAAAFTRGDFKLEGSYGTPRIAHAAMEPAAALAWWEGDRLTVVTGTQGIFAARKDLAEDLEIPLEKVRVITQYKGGGFGNKDGATYHDLIAAILAKRTKKPVLLQYTRTEDFLGGHTRWATEVHLRGAASRADGRLLAIDLKSFSDLGAYDTYANAIYSQGPESYYACDAWQAEVYGVYTNHVATGPMRAPQNPHACFATETFVDETAHALGINPLDFHLNNAVVVPQLDQSFTSNGLRECLILGARAFDWERRWRRPPSEPVTRGNLVGTGMAMATRKSNMGASEAVVSLRADGGVELLAGVVDIGAGAKTTMSLITANELGLPVERVHITWGDTDSTPYSVGEGGSRMTTSTGQAVRQAARQVRQRLLSLASSQLGAPPERLRLEDGRILSRGGAGVRFEEILVAAGMTALEEHAKTEPVLPEKTIRHSFAAHFAEVEVDAETGETRVTDYVAVHDSGEIVNKLTAESQVQGGVIMGIGMALQERLMTDADSGSVQNPSLLTYRVTNHVSVPKIRPFFVETSDPFGPKGLGEITCVPVAPAVGNAIFNATGVRLRRLPFSPESLLRAAEPRA